MSERAIRAIRNGHSRLSAKTRYLLLRNGEGTPERIKQGQNLHALPLFPFALLPLALALESRICAKVIEQLAQA
jgi:hypothetical protein